MINFQGCILIFCSSLNSAKSSLACLVLTFLVLLFQENLINSSDKNSLKLTYQIEKDYEVVTRLERLIQNHHATNAGLHPG